MDILKIAERQLALDYGCTVEALHGRKNLVLPMPSARGARPVADEDCLLKILSYNGSLMINAAGPMLDWCREKLSTTDAVWVCEPQKLVSIDAALCRHGQCLADAHHYYLPTGVTPLPQCDCSVCWYEGEQLAQFEDDERFDEALVFDEDMPDMLAVTLEKDGEILAMAGASRDSAQLWQIGVNVVPQSRSRGLGTYVVTALKNRLLEQNIVPFYGTVESHIASQRIALRAGFLPTFYEMHAE